MNEPDFLIIGGGSAGATLASLLSEDPATRVLLIEAGADTPPGAVPADISDTFPSSSLNPNYFWPGLEAVPFADGLLRPFPQARIMGGGSTVMGMWALRGLPADFDAWRTVGAVGWGWSDVAAYFRRIEDDLDRDRSQMPRGSYPIRRVPHEQWPAFVSGLERAAAVRGLRPVPDINEGPAEGFFPMPISRDDVRASSARCYLGPSVRRRSNLAIMPCNRATALEVDGGRVGTVTVERDGAVVRIRPREVVLSAGAIHSPVLLMRSGIGAASALQSSGVTPRVDRPGVGRNLQNHPYLHFALTLPPGGRLAGHLRHFAIAGVRHSSGHPEGSAGDLLAFAIGRVSPRSHGPDFAMVGAALYAPHSRGEVTLTAPDRPPRIDFRMLSDPRDPPRLLAAARFAEQLIRDPAMAGTFSEAFLMPPLMSLNQFNRPGLAGALLGLGAKAVLNAPAPIRRRVLERLLRPGRWFADRSRRLPLSDAELLGAAASMAHPVGTCAIGRPDDPMAVVDPSCRVYGVGNLRVVDASIMPRIPCANTNLPTLMIAHRAADLIRARA